MSVNDPLIIRENLSFGKRKEKKWISSFPVMPFCIFCARKKMNLDSRFNL